MQALSNFIWEQENGEINKMKGKQIYRERKLNIFKPRKSDEKQKSRYRIAVNVLFLNS